MSILRDRAGAPTRAFAGACGMGSPSALQRKAPPQGQACGRPQEPPCWPLCPVLRRGLVTSPPALGVGTRGSQVGEDGGEGTLVTEVR